MMSSTTITLFSDSPSIHRRPSSFFVSMLFHGVVVAALLGIQHMPRLLDPPHSPPATARLLDLQRQKNQIRWKAEGLTAPSPVSDVKAKPASGGMRIPPRSVASPLQDLPKTLQTLIQPDAPPKILPTRDLKLPVIVLWTPELIPPSKLAPQPPHEPSVVQVRPAIVRPNFETNVADVKLAATLFPPKVPLLAPSTTSPLIVHGPQSPRQLPQTSSVSVAQPTPAQVISLSAIPSTQQTVSIPFENQSAYAEPTTSLREVHTDQPVASSGRKSNIRQDGAGAGKNSQPGADGPTNGKSSSGQGGTDPASDEGSIQGPVLGTEASITHVSLPKNGQFGFVVVGSSMAEQYPETVALWEGRLVYSVYLHVGTGKNWILQYALPRAAEAAAAGNAMRPEAPWPYDIARPTLAPGDANPDVIMAHGFVDVAGRPASQNGTTARVEVLLIMPQDLE
jgi:hypothetical protein